MNAIFYSVYTKTFLLLWRILSVYRDLWPRPPYIVSHFNSSLNFYLTIENIVESPIDSVVIIFRPSLYPYLDSYVGTESLTSAPRFYLRTEITILLYYARPSLSRWLS
ncbi:hypothetical protein OIDMADRAFT_20147 [Oidiodendron maius Zn]|uniref:Uncharacterized protein n=1 Tax=Oidiodendron maius (strain Zn) TaxID=913774 RepID=A0A0C3H5W6_OIDMZ|nr:hypothetical protein OIDMADRAFT_20147 [Oidiodendron maius Zn]